MSATRSGHGRSFLRLSSALDASKRLVTLLLAAAAVLGVLTPAAGGQVTYSGSAVDFGSVTLGAAPGSATVQFSAAAGTTAIIGGVSAVSQGAPVQDFTIASTTCAGLLTGPATCTVKVSFAPVGRGLRSGALLVSVTGQPQTQVFLHGVGVGSQLVFSPDSATVTGTVTPLLPVYYSPSTLVYDGAGNLFFNDFLNNRILEQSAAGALTTVLSLPGTINSSMAISGTGTLFVTVPSSDAVYAIVPGASAAALPYPAGTFSRPSGIAVDGSGNVYVADVNNNRIVRSAFDGSGSTVLALTGLTKPLAGPQGLALDASGNLYIVDSGNARIIKVALATLAATQVTITGQFPYQPYGVAVDAAGTLYLCDTGNRRVLRIPAAGTATVISTPNFAFSSPTGIIVATNGDLIVADNVNGLTRVTRATPTSTITFSTPTNVGALDSADGAKNVSLENVGNAPLQLTLPTGTATNPSTSTTSFAVSNVSTCPVAVSTTAAANAQIASGTVCTYAVSFTPNAAGTNTGALIVKTTPTGSGTISSSVPLSGTGVAVIDSFIVTAPATASVGMPVSFTVAARLAGATATGYLGTVTLTSSDPAAKFLSGTTYTFTAADAGVHTFTAPASGITFGSVGTFTITATDGANSGVSAGTVVKAATTVDGFTVVAPATATVGTPVSFTVSATLGGAISSGYTGTVTFTTTDATATFLSGTTYTFTAADAGVHTFTAPASGIQFGSVGIFTVKATAGTASGTSGPVTVSTPPVITPSITLQSGVSTLFLNNGSTLTANVTSTGGTPTGSVTFFVNGVSIGTAMLINGTATLTNAAFTTYGQVKVSATYNGSAGFATVTSLTLVENVEDFNLAPATTAAASASVLPGGMASFLFTVNILGPAPSPAAITLSVTGLPAGATAVFTPSNILAAGISSATPTLAVVIPTTSATMVRPAPRTSPLAPVTLALLLLPLVSRRVRRRAVPTLLLLFVVTAGTFGLSGCLSDQTSGYFGQTPQSYILTIYATSGALTHTTTVTLIVQ